MTAEFTADDGVQRLVVGVGAAGQLGAELDRLGVERPLIISAPSAAAHAYRLTAELRVVEVIASAQAHVPVAAAQAAAARAATGQADSLVAIGGGAATGLAKAVARRLRLPIVALPSTFAGSEATPVWGETGPDGKHTGRDRAALPCVVLADPLLAVDVPHDVLAASGLNALAHLHAAVAGPQANPAARLFAVAGARLLLTALLAALTGDQAAHAQGLWAAQLTARGFAIAGAGAHHRACHVLGGEFATPHAPTHAALAPHSFAALPTAVRVDLTAELGVDPAVGVAELGARLGVQPRLAAYLPAAQREAAFARCREATRGLWSAQTAQTVLEAAYDGAKPRLP